MSVLPFTGERRCDVEVEIELGDGVASRSIPDGTVVEVCGSSPADIINSVNKAAQILAWDTRTLARLANSLIPLLETNPTLIDSLDSSVSEALLAAARSRVATMSVGELITAARSLQAGYGVDAAKGTQQQAWQELDAEYSAMMAGR